MPKFVLSIYSDESAWATFSPEDAQKAIDAYWAFQDEVEKAGAFIAGEALQPSATAKTVHNQDGNPKITDGPFTETKEQFGGFYLIECKDQDEALEWAKKIPPGSSIEVRQVQEFAR